MSDFAKFRFGLIILILLGVSLFKGCEEIRYTLFGEVTEVTSSTVRQYTYRGRRGSRSEKLEFTYTFLDNDKSRTEQDTVSLDYAVPKPLRVQYIPNSTDSRIEGHTERFWLIILAVAFLAAIIAAIKFWRFYKS